MLKKDIKAIISWFKTNIQLLQNHDEFLKYYEEKKRKSTWITAIACVVVVLVFSPLFGGPGFGAAIVSIAGHLGLVVGVIFAILYVSVSIIILSIIGGVSIAWILNFGRMKIERWKK